MSHKKTETALTERLKELLAQYKIKVIMLDEMQHLTIDNTLKTDGETIVDNNIEEIKSC